ncbi:MAG: hypothetical protein KF708_23940, partial [Pirellulales bacterium]|nr:hypothetical protein [Pirellulales bacterium]
MIASLLLLACSVPTVDVGWLQLEDGAYEYIIQIDPDQLESMRAGRDILSDLPPALHHIRRYRITVGNAPLPHEGVPPELIGAPPVGAPDRAPSATGAPADPDNVAGGPMLIGPRTSLPLNALPGPGDDEPLPAATGPAIVEAEIVVEEPLVEASPAVEDTPPPAVETAPVEPPTFVMTEEEPEPAPVRPQPFDAPIDSRPIVEQASNAVAVSAPVASTTDTPQPTLVGKAVAGEEPQWWALTAALVILFVSLGVNLYLGWVTWGTRLRYRELIRRMDVRAKT